MKINSLSLRLALSQRSQSMARKLPIVAFAALACYGLYYLDSAKKGFDEAKSRPLFIDEKFKSRLQAEVAAKDGADQAWPQIANLISVNQYSTQEDFINKVADQISRTAETKEFVAQAAFKGCIAKALPNTVAATGANESAPGNEETQKQAQPVDPDKCSDDYIAARAKTYTDAQDKIAIVYRYLKPLNLKRIRENLDDEETKSKGAGAVVIEKSYLEASLQPILDDKSGLYVIYQVFRMSCVVIIVFTLIAFVALLLRALLLTDGVKVVTERATALIGGGGSAIPNIAKTAIVSVAALGVGTAVVAGVTINNKADQALAQVENGAGGPGKTGSRWFRSSSGASRGPGGLGGVGGLGLGGPGGPGGLTTVGHYDSENTQYDYSRGDSFYDISDKRTTENTTSLPPVVQVFPRIHVAAPGATKTEVGLSADLTAKMRTYFDSQTQANNLSTALVTDIKSSLESLTQVNKELSSKLALLTAPSRSDDVKVANQDLLKPLLIDFQADSQNLEKLNKTLADLQSLNLDNPLQPRGRPTIRSWLFGSSRYFVSKRTASQLTALIKGKDDHLRREQEKLLAEAKLDKTKELAAQEKVKENEVIFKADALISTTLELLYLSGGKPMDKQEFLKQAEMILRELLKSDQNQDVTSTINRLNSWSTTILTYAKIS
jgi:hypothetical protein